MNHISKNLKEGLDLSVLSKKTNSRSASIAISKTGNYYLSGKFETQNHLLNIPSEQGALVLAMQNNDFGIEEILTMGESENHVDPLILKIIKDYSLRTGNIISYGVSDKNLKTAYQIGNINSELQFYKPNLIQLEKTKNFIPESNIIKVNEEDNFIELLRKYSIKGITRNFPNYDSASGYGAAVITKNNNLYFSGQYSSPDNRLGVHAEAAAILSAVMNKDPEILYLGVVSSKFKDKSCAMCGSCRQFLVEHANKTSSKVQIYSFAKEKSEFKTYDLESYLPDSFIL
jgi:cytidine deaminase